MNFKPTLERLEQRHLCAGNVSASVVDGDLLVLGDNLSNRITIESAGAGTVQVRGFNDPGGATRVNGVADSPQIFPGVTGDVVVRLRGGNDLVRVTNLVSSGDVIIDLGDGNDEAVTGRDKLGGDGRFGATPSGPLAVSGDVRVVGGAGNDLAYQSDLHVQGLGVVSLGVGNDTLFLQRPANGSQNVDYVGNFTVLPGLGDDTVDLLGLVVNGDLAVTDNGGALFLVARSMDVGRDFRLVTSAAADTIDVSATNVTNRFTLNTGAGDDNVRLFAIADHMVVHLGAGNDDLELIGNHTETLVVRGGDGNDVFLVRNTRSIDADFHGDAGTDSYRTTSSLPNRITRLRRFTLESLQ